MGESLGIYLHTVSSEFHQERTLAYPIHKARVGFPLTQEIFVGNQAYCLISLIKQLSGCYYHLTGPVRCQWFQTDTVLVVFRPYGQGQSPTHLDLQ